MMDQVYVRCSVQVLRSILDHKQRNIFSLKFSQMINLLEQKRKMLNFKNFKADFLLKLYKSAFAASDWEKSLENKLDLVDNLD